MKYFFIGDQGVSMRGIKKYMQFLGNTVAGSDLKTGGHNAKNITLDIDIVVRSSAVSPGSDGWQEVIAAQKLGIKVIKRSELLGEITKDKKLIAVSGMHGKTTITAMVGLLLIEAGFDPTVLVGENVKEFDDDVIRIGKSEWFVAEACEYDRSFLDFKPFILIMTNIEEEHLDTYPGGLTEIKQTFEKYLNNVRDGGIIIACYDDENVVDVIEKANLRQKIIYYGKTAPKYNQLKYELKIPGDHNIVNALSVAALADYLKIDQKKVKEVLQKFTGAKRRFEYKGEYNGAQIIDDYGHHPTEIKVTIDALAQKYPDKKKYVVFWPHQYKRILPLLDKFSEAFSSADYLIIKPIFFVPGRDEHLEISSLDLVKKINIDRELAHYLETDEEIIQFLKKRLDKDSVLLTIGIPPVYKIAEALAKSKE